MFRGLKFGLTSGFEFGSYTRAAPAGSSRSNMAKVMKGMKAKDIGKVMKMSKDWDAKKVAEWVADADEVWPRRRHLARAALPPGTPYPVAPAPPALIHGALASPCIVRGLACRSTRRCSSTRISLGMSCPNWPVRAPVATAAAAAAGALPPAHHVPPV